MQADIIRLFPGDLASVMVQADANGNIPTRGDRVKVVGEQDDVPIVSLVEAQGDTSIGKLENYDVDVDESATYSASELVGMASMILSNIVTTETPLGTYTASVGDLVQAADGGGVEAYVGATTQDPAGPLGMVLKTTIPEFGAGEGIAVANLR